MTATTAWRRTSTNHRPSRGHPRPSVGPFHACCAIQSVWKLVHSIIREATSQAGHAHAALWNWIWPMVRRSWFRVAASCLMEIQDHGAGIWRIDDRIRLLMGE